MADKVGRGRARRDPHHAYGAEPFGTEVRHRLNVVSVRTILTARIYQFTRVVAGRAADDNDDVALARQLACGVLALLGWLTDRVDETDVGLGESPPDERDQVLYPLDRLRGLRGNADARMLVELQHVFLVQHDIE